MGETAQLPQYYGGACGNDTDISRSPKKHKNKSKVWDKVAWFSKRSRPKSQSGLYDLSLEGPVSEDEYSPSTMSHSPAAFRSFLSSDSSCEMDINEKRTSSVRQLKLYPNSEVIEQSCLKPSIAKALFMQLEAVHLGSDSNPKYAWYRPKSKKTFNHYNGIEPFDESEDSDDVLLQRTLSMPDTITERNKCHCIACCGCSPRERLSGECPVYRRRCTSTTSLDRGLDDFQSLSDHCGLECIPDEYTPLKPATLPKQARDNEMHKIFDDKQVNDLNSEKFCRHCYRLKYIELPIKADIKQKNVNISLEKNKQDKLFCECESKLPCVDVGLISQTINSLPMTLSIPNPSISVVPNATLSALSSSTKNKLCDTSDTQCDSFYDSPCSPSKFKEKADELDEWFSSLNDERKNVMLFRLLGHCGVPQKHFLCEALDTESHPHCPPNCQDRISWLPHSLVLHIFSYLGPESLATASEVCKVWHNLANESSLWRKFCTRPKWKLSRTGEQKQIIQHMLPDGNVNWKKVFAERYHLRNNWLNGRCTVRTFEGHTQGISCVQFDDTRIVSGSSDKTIKVWNIRTNSPWSVQTLVGHSGTVRCLHLEGNRLVSGSTDTTIKVWDLSTQHSWSSIACKVTMVGHTDTVRCLQVDDEKVISGSYDQKLKIWSVRTGRCRKTLRGHQAAVLCVRFDQSKIVSGSCDKTIKVWNFDGACIMTLQGHQDAVTCLQFDSQRIISGSLDCNLKFWDIHTGQCNNTIDWKASEGHTGVVRCLQADSWRIVSASDDRTLKVWSLETGQRLATLRNHTDGVTCLQFNDSIIVSGSYDKTVKLWDFSSV